MATSSASGRTRCSTCSTFVADGDAYGDTGYNQIGNKNKVVNFDATGDANARSRTG